MTAKVHLSHKFNSIIDSEHKVNAFSNTVVVTVNITVKATVTVIKSINITLIVTVELIVNITLDITVNVAVTMMLTFFRYSHCDKVNKRDSETTVQ